MKKSLQLFALLLSVVSVHSFVGSFPFHGGGVGVCSAQRHIRYATVPTEEEEELAPSSDWKGPDMKAYASDYKTVFEELPCKSCSASVGSIPKDLQGTYFRSGPAMFSAGSIVPPKKSIVQPRQPPVPDGQDADRMVKHPFEGDGAILAVTFAPDGEVTARFRFVRTIAFTAERKKGQRTYTGMDSSRELGPAAAGGLGNDLPLPLYRHHLLPGLNKLRKNTSNTRAVYWGSRLLTLWEGGQPYKLDALALSTEGRSQLGGAILKEADPFGSKMVYDPVQNRAIFYAIEHGPTRSEFKLFEFDSNFKLVPGGRTSTDLPGFAMVTDMGATENYAVIVQPNIAAKSTLKYLVEQAPGKILEVVNDESATVHLIPRPGSSKPQKSFSIPWDGALEGNLQVINAYEAGDNVLVDVIRSDGSKVTSNRPLSWPWGSTLEEYQSTSSLKSLWRYAINVRSGEVTKHCLCDTNGFFAVVNPSVSTQRHRYIYMAVGSLGAEVAPPQGICRFDCETEQTETWMPHEYEFCGEPMFAPKTPSSETPKEDDGYILSVLYNGQSEESELVILEASNIANGPVARIPLGMAIPHGHFGCFSSSKEATWSTETIQRRAKLSDKMEAQGNMWNEVKSDFSGLGLRLDDMEEYFGDFFS